MSDDEAAEIAFLGAIQSEASDDSRLVYADWLEEHGEQTRAEYIRLESDLHKLALLGGGREYLLLQGRRKRLREELALSDAAWIAKVDRADPKREARRDVAADARYAQSAALPTVALSSPRNPFAVPYVAIGTTSTEEPPPKSIRERFFVGEANIALRRTELEVAEELRKIERCRRCHRELERDVDGGCLSCGHQPMTARRARGILLLVFVVVAWSVLLYSYCSEHHSSEPTPPPALHGIF